MPATNAERRRRYYQRWRTKHLRWAKEHPLLAERYKRKHHLKHEFGLTLEAYDAMLAAQGGVCAICCKPESHRSTKNLAVDHCHATGKIRGLLCYRCNTLIGYAKDSASTLRAAVIYLENRNG